MEPEVPRPLTIARNDQQTQEPQQQTAAFRF
jgi:hypothetical protein